MSRYAVTVETVVLVEARNAQDAKARGETAVRTTIAHAYDGTRPPGDLFADGWHRYTFRARKAERVPDDE